MSDSSGLPGGRERVPGRAKRIVGSIVLTLLIIATLAAIYAVTFAPGHYSNLNTEVANGEQEFPVASASSGGRVAVVTPAEDWTVQPLVQQVEVPVLSDLPRPPLPNDPRMLLGVNRGIELFAPDRGLRINISAVETGENLQTEIEDRRDLLEREANENSAAGEGAVQLRIITETLANGALLVRLDRDGSAVGDYEHEIFAGLELADGADAVYGADAADGADTIDGAEVADGGEVADAQSGAEAEAEAEAEGSGHSEDTAQDAAGADLRITVHLTDSGLDAGRTIDDYRPAISALLESVRAV